MGLGSGLGLGRFFVFVFSFFPFYFFGELCAGPISDQAPVHGQSFAGGFAVCTVLTMPSYYPGPILPACVFFALGLSPAGRPRVNKRRDGGRARAQTDPDDHRESAYMARRAKSYRYECRRKESETMIIPERKGIEMAIIAGKEGETE